MSAQVDALAKAWMEKITRNRAEYDAALEAGDEVRMWELAQVEAALFAGWRQELAVAKKVESSD